MTTPTPPLDARAVLDRFAAQIRDAATTADTGLDNEMADRQLLLETLLNRIDVAFRNLPQEYR